MAEIRITDTEVILKKPTAIMPKTEPFWRIPSFKRVIGAINLDDNYKTYKTIVFKKESILGYSVIKEIHTIEFILINNHKEDIQFEDEEHYIASLEQLVGIFDKSQINLKI